MSETLRQQLFTGATFGVLLILTGLGNDLLTVGAAAILLAVGFIALPRQRARGLLAAVVAACVAAVLVALTR